MKVVYPVPNRCMNCRLCEVACILEHSRSKAPLPAYHGEGLAFNWEWVGEFPDPAEARAAGRAAPLSRCRVSTDQAAFVSVMCRHCEVAPCVLACKNGSLSRDENGRVRVDEEKCVGCWMCIMACPYGVITRNIHRGNVADQPGNGINHHCDLCPDRAEPACVHACPTRALVYEER